MQTQAVRRSEDVGTAPREVDLRAVRRSRNLRRLLLAILAAVVLVGATGRLGARTSTVTAEAGGYRLTVVYPAVTRPGLAVRWIVLVHRTGGFDGPIQLATTSTYFNLLDFNNFDPNPDAFTSTGTLSIWTFDQPPGETLRVALDGRLEPARQHGSQARTALMIGGVTVVSVDYYTRVMP